MRQRDPHAGPFDWMLHEVVYGGHDYMAFLLNHTDFPWAYLACDFWFVTLAIYDPLPTVLERGW